VTNSTATRSSAGASEREQQLGGGETAAGDGDP
jgi:hypothetical protein